jgi:hypothetical protein
MDKETQVDLKLLPISQSVDVETGYLALKPLLRTTLSVSWERCRQMQFSATSRP